jgi:hypothetical protein
MKYKLCAKNSIILMALIFKLNKVRSVEIFLPNGNPEEEVTATLELLGKGMQLSTLLRHIRQLADHELMLQTVQPEHLFTGKPDITRR